MERRTLELRGAVLRRDEAELKEAIREARRQELAEAEIARAVEAWAEVLLERKLSWLGTAIEQRDEDSLRQLLLELRKVEVQEKLLGQVEEALQRGQEALSGLVLAREVETLAAAQRSGSESRLREAIEQAREANVAPESLVSHEHGRRSSGNGCPQGLCHL